MQWSEMAGRRAIPAPVGCFQMLIFITGIFVIVTCLLLSTRIFSSPKIFSFDENKKLFRVVITDDDRAIFMKLIKTFERVVPSNVTYFLHGGTLLGSYRHHDMIPWDDDLDLCTREKDKGVLLRTLRALEPEYMITTERSTLWKFYHNSSTPTRWNWGAWPSIDIFFYTENETHLWDTNSAISEYKHEKKDVFPLVTRPFMDMFLPTPNKIDLFLGKFFDVAMCESNSWSHKFQEDIKVVISIPCEWLDNFVYYDKQTGRSVESGTVV